MSDYATMQRQINDKCEFLFGKKLFNPDNGNWQQFILDPAFDLHCFAEALEEYADGGHVWSAELGRAVQILYRRKLRDRSNRSLELERNSRHAIRCHACFDHRKVYFAMDERGAVYDFRNPDPRREFRGCGVCDCPFCAPDNLPSGVVDRLKECYMPLYVSPRSSFYPKSCDWNCDISGDKAIQFFLREAGILHF